MKFPSFRPTGLTPSESKPLQATLLHKTSPTEHVDQVRITSASPHVFCHRPCHEILRIKPKLEIDTTRPGQRLQKTMEKSTISPFSMGKSTMSMGIFSSYVNVYQAGYLYQNKHFISDPASMCKGSKESSPSEGEAFGSLEVI